MNDESVVIQWRILKNFETPKIVRKDAELTKF